MAATLPVICIRLIIKELNNNLKAKHSCILINRHWCVSSIREIWSHPFYSCRELGEKERYIQLMDTLIKCLPQKVRESLELESITKTTFDYTSFSNWFCPNLIINCVRIWLSGKAKEGSIKNNLFHSISTYEQKIFTITKALCEHILISSKKIIGVKLNYGYSGIFGMFNIYELPQANQSLSNITTLDVPISHETETFFSAIKISNNIHILKLTCCDLSSEQNIQNIIQLIKNQKKLEEITIKYWNAGLLKIWSSLQQHYNIITKIALNDIYFDQNPFPLHQLSLIKNLQILKIRNCSKFNFSSNEIDLTYSFTKLKTFSIAMTADIPKDFIIIVLKQSNGTLRTLKLINIFISKDFLPYCIELGRLLDFSCSIDCFETFNLLPSLLRLSNNLKTLHINQLYDNIIHPDDFLYLLGQNFPKSLYYFAIELDQKFSLKSFSKFLNICKEKGIKFSILKFPQSKFFNDSYLYELLKYYDNMKLDELLIYYDKRNFSNECLEILRKNVGSIKFFPQRYYLV